MISIEQGLHIVSKRVQAEVGEDFMPTEQVSLIDSIGRTLRQDVSADLDSPPFDRSVRDGFALRAEDVRSVPIELDVVGESRAGSSYDGSIGRGQCVAIMTGSEVPSGADAVVMVENTEKVSEQRVRILEGVRAGRSIQTEGTECRKGDRLLQSGSEIQVPEIGLLASVGCARVRVSRRPRVAILSTGDELVPVDQKPGRAQIRNSNSFTLMAQVAAAGGEPEVLGIVSDDVEDLGQRIGQALERDIVITSGGVSMGKYDLVEGVLADHGVEIGFDKVAMKPGKPTVFGWRGRTFVFGLPGNPVSTIVSFQLFVRPLIRRLLHVRDAGDHFLEANLEQDVRCDGVRAACVPARVSFGDGGYRLKTVDWKGSSDLVGLSRANAYVLIPQQEGSLTAGTRVRFIPMAQSLC
jgi:molybdopterin molybdotransferase